ncbi:hemagglutinin repeat-containing protein [Paraburkholderia tropica]|uniref:hemagglutinin repeat-containing protein n=1 Tax=Paraburkholderia tropica TaxID=92647 RepID=UPI002AB7A261|nr:hemagglutinin repeat-containing protein [Paraburkholderia tropica]
MNNRCYRLVFSKLRGMIVAVAETAVGNGKAGRGEAGPSVPLRSSTLFTIRRHARLALLTLFGVAPAFSNAQIVPSGTHAPGVINTANGLPQVNIQKPSGAGVSLNTYSQFDVGRNGAILNNSPTITSTQIAGQINGNPNFGANDAAKIIVNQVNSNSPSQLRGYVEVAGAKTAAVVIANSSGLVVDGGGFINTSKGILTTGNPIIDSGGNLTGFNVTSGTITLQGAGLNASNIDEVDLLSRAVQANAAIYGNTLHVVTGSNSIDYASLNPTPIAGSGAAPGVSIDVAQLGGMYANRIILVGNENGVGVANAGTIAAQAGDLTLTTAGQLVQSGKMNASGNIGVVAAGIANTGTIYGQQNSTISSSGALTNGGTIASQQNTVINAASVASSGLLGAGINPDSTTGTGGSLSVTSAGLLSATGQTMAPGTVSLYGVTLDLSGAQVSAGGALALTATGGNMGLSGANATAGTSFTVDSAGTLDSGNAKLGSGAAMQLTAAQITNAGGQAVAGTTLNVQTAGALDNLQGILQAAGQETIEAGSVDNTEGKILSLNADGLTVNASGALVNGAGGVIGGNGNVSLSAGSISNAGQFSALGNAALVAQSISNNGGSASAGGALSAQASGALSNIGGQFSATDVSLSGASIDNTSGQIDGTQVSVLTPGDLLNRKGTIEQSGTADQTVSAGGTLDDTGGTIATNAQNLTVSGGNIVNDDGEIQHAGTGALDVAATNAISNANGSIGTNGALRESAASLANQGRILAVGNATLRNTTLDNHAGSILAGGALNALTIGAMNNEGGALNGVATSVSGSSIENGNGGQIVGTTVAVSASGDLNNSGGTIQQSGTADQTINAGGAFENAGGTVGSNATNLTLSGASIDNDGGAVSHAGTGTLAITTPGVLSSVAGQIATNGALNLQSASLDNTGGVLSAEQSANVSAVSGIANANGGQIYGNTGLAATTQGDFNNAGGSAQSGGNIVITAGGALGNANGVISANGAVGTLAVTASSVDNTSGTLTNSGSGKTTIAATSDIANTGGVMGGNGDVEIDAKTLKNNANAQLVAAGAADLKVTGQVDNTNGLAYGGTSLNLDQAGVALVNGSGKIEGGKDVSLQVASMSNGGGAVNANHDISMSGALSGGGSMTAGNNLSVTLPGDYTNDGTSSFNADNNLTFTLPGTLSNNSVLEAANALTVNAGKVVNGANAHMNSATTTVNAANDINNAGVIEGNNVTTKSSTLENTGALIGNNVVVNAGDVTNNGAQAVIAGATFVGVYASNSITNENGALIYSGGNMELARDNARDSTGLLADQTGTIENSASTIEATGNIDVAAHTLNNDRTGVQTQAGTPVTTTGSTLTLWTAGIPISELGSYESVTYPQWYFKAGAVGTESIQVLSKPLTVTLPASQVTNINSGNQTFSLTTALTDTYYTDLYCPDCTPQTRTITNNPTQYYQSLTQNANGTVTISFYPDYNPNVNINPAQVQVRYDLGTDSHDYVELSRTVTTTTSTDQLLNAGTAALMQAQGAIRINSDGGAINNNSSTMAAGGDLVRRATGGSVNDNGIVLQQTGSETDTSVFYWHQKTGGSNDTQTVNDTAVPLPTTTVAALPAIATSNQTVETDAENINIGSVNRVAQTVTGTGVAGGDATGMQLDSVSGAGSGPQASASVVSNGKRPQTLGSAGVAIPGLVLPKNALYSYNTAPGAEYLVETNSRFTSYTQFVSSDYMLNALGLDPQNVEKRLGDGMYEEQLVMNQVTQLTGRTFLGSYTDNLDEYTALMNNGVQYAQSFGLSVGVALTPAQMSELTTDMVWLVNQTVTLPDGTQQTVLVPQLYLAQSNTVDLQDSGALVAGKDVDLNATGDVTNSGHVAGDVATTVIDNNVVNRGVIGSGGTTTVQAVQDVSNLGGRIGGVDTVVTAGNDIINQSTVAQAAVTTGNAGFSSTATGMAVQSVGTISATNSATLIAGHDVDLTGSAIQTGGDATIAAGHDINVGTTTLTATQDAGMTDGEAFGHATATHNVGSTITAGGNLTTVSGNDTTLTDAKVQAGGDATMVAAGNLTVTAAKDTATYNGQSMGGKISEHKDSTYDESVQGSSINAGGNATLAAGQGSTGNLSVLGSSVTTGGVNGATGGAVSLQSTGDINVGSVAGEHDASHWSHTNESGFLSSDKTTDSSTSQQSIAQGSTVSGNTVAANASHDLTIAGSTVASTGDMSLAAGHDLTVTTTQDTSQSSTFHEEQKSGFGALSGGGASINYGTSDQKTTTHDSSVTNNGSLVGSTGGSVSMTAGNNLTVTGSDVIAAQNVTGTAANVTINAATDTSHHDETQEMHQSGFTLGLGGSVGDAINNAISQSEDVGSSSRNGDSRAAALHAIAAGGDAAIGVAGATGGALAGSSPSISIQLSFGTSQSKSTSSEDQTTQQGSSVQAGGKASFTATGNSTPGSGNVTIAGSSISANDVVLAAKNQVDIVNTTNTDTTASSNSSSSASVGVSYGTQGFGVSASMANAHGDANSNAAIQNNSHVTGTNSVTITSGGDTNVIGSDVSGGQVTASVGGNLNVQSVQDTTVSTAHQSSTSAGFSISQGGGSASFSAQNGHADSNYAQVNEQAGIQAGSGGFDINVKGNTNLTGAVISSTADPSQNSLTTGTLAYSDIENQSHYDATSNGVSAGVGWGSTGKAVGPGSVSGTGGVSPMITQNDSGDSSATTRSAISAGTINVTDQARQTQDVSGLSRDTTDTNGTVSKTPDVNSLLSQQADTMQAAQAAGQVVSQGIGAYADMKRDAALDSADAAMKSGDYATAAADVADAQQWMEGGDSRAMLQAAGGALIGGLGGGSVFTAVGGAVGAGLSSKLADQMKTASDAVADATGSSLLGNLSGNVLAGIGGALIGGSAGAAMASNVDLYNQNNDKGNEAAKKKAAAILAQIATLPSTASINTSLSNARAGIWNAGVDVVSVIANIPNGGPFASPSDPGYISLNGLKVPYTSGDQIGATVELLAPMLMTGSTGAAELEGITGSAQSLFEQLPARLQTKTVATDGVTNTISGYGTYLPDGYTFVDPAAVAQRASDIGHNLPAAGAMDQGVLGQYNASHAEKQAIVNNPAANQIDVSRPMCTDCQAFFQAEAAAQNRPIVVSDPNTTRTFLPNGNVTVTPSKK